jgi:hypothetical protein
MKFFSLFRRKENQPPKSMFIVRKDPKDDPREDDYGFRYYLPKPYLLVSYKRGVESNPTTGNTIEKVAPDVKVIYLPDIAERYSVTIKSKLLGSFEGSLPLTDGWMLTQINQKYDAKMAETIQAFASMVSAVKPTLPISQPPAAPLKKALAPEAPGAAPTPIPLTPFYLYEIDLRDRQLIPLQPPLLP